MLVLVLVAELAPFRVVAVLLPAARIEPGRLDVAVGGGADPHGFVGWRNADRLDALDHGGVGDALAVLIVVAESGARPLARVPGRGVADVPEAFLSDGGGNLAGTVQNLFVFSGLSEH